MADDFIGSALDEVGKALNEVGKMIDDAVKRGDYSDLCGQIGEAMGKAVDAASDAGKAAAGAAYESLTGSASPGQEAARRASAERRAARDRQRAEKEKRAADEARTDKYFVRPPDLTGSVMMEVLGGAGTVIFGLMTLFLAVFGTVLSGVVTMPLAILSGVLTAISIAIMFAGRRKVVRGRRFKSYRVKLAPKLYAEVKDLAVEMGLPEKTVASDLESFTKEGMIREGHFDQAGKTFIASDELYAQYMDSVKREQEAKLKRDADEASKKRAEYSPQVEEILRKGNDYIARIRQANDAIPDEVISAKLDQTESIVRKIFAEVRERPELAGNLDMFMSYYLPTVTKLITAYGEMDSSNVDVANVRKAKEEIASSLDTFNEAFETLLDSFFRERVMDVTSDINVMKMMMQQEGLTKDDMSAMKAAKKAEAAAAAGQTAPAAAGQTAPASAGQTAAASAGQAAASAGQTAAASAGQTAAGAGQTASAAAAQTAEAAAEQKE